MRHEAQIEVQGKPIAVSNLEKVIYPKANFTKGNVIDYYIRIAPVLLPHLKNRPLTLKRYPEGVEGFFFYEKRCPAHRPDWVKTVRVWSERNQEEIPFCLVNDLRTLVWAANLADLELHTSLSQARAIDRPTMLVFDLDPGPPADIIQCCEVAMWLKKLFDGIGLESFPKTSGSKGLQIYVPLNTPVDYDETKSFAKAVAERLRDEHPQLVVSNMLKSLRKGKVFVDWSQNDDHKTTICAYSLRAREKPTVSTPLNWSEVERARKTKNAAALVFESSDTLRRVEKQGDLFEPVLRLKQRLKAL
jgi:bifunctional non-homologous end joining protein LigD